VSAIFEQIKDSPEQLWECKDCHRLTSSDENLAYHLVDRVLYGWCERCFARRNDSSGA
jgi:hypothetical protein